MGASRMGPSRLGQNRAGSRQGQGPSLFVNDMPRKPSIVLERGESQMDRGAGSRAGSRVGSRQGAVPSAFAARTLIIPDISSGKQICTISLVRCTA